MMETRPEKGLSGPRAEGADTMIASQPQRLEEKKQHVSLRERTKHRVLIIPDGNCLYPAVSKAVCGHQDQDQELRENTVNHMARNLDLFRLRIEGNVKEFLQSRTG